MLIGARAAHAPCHRLTLVAIVGPPGAGKTTLGRRVASEFAESAADVVLLARCLHLDDNDDGIADADEEPRRATARSLNRVEGHFRGPRRRETALSVASSLGRVRRNLFKSPLARPLPRQTANNAGGDGQRGAAPPRRLGPNHRRELHTPGMRAYAKHSRVAPRGCENNQ